MSERGGWMVRALAGVVLGAATGRGADSATTPYEAKVYRADNGGTLPYLLLQPAAVAPGQRYPLVLFLHGAGERGTNNTAQLKHVLPVFVRPDVRAAHPCFVLAPQCPSARRWVEVDWAALVHAAPAEPSVPLGLASALLDECLRTLPVDPARVYVAGISMGGFGTWDAISRWPERFAAAIPVCGGGDLAQAPKIARLPLWAFHGDQDKAVPLSRTTGMSVALRQAGGNPKLTVYPGVGHDAWTPAFNDPALLTWLFGQRRGGQPAQ